MRSLLFSLFFITTLLQAEPTLETQLIEACRDGNTPAVKNILQQKVLVTQKAFKCALERGSLDIADLLHTHASTLSIKKSWFREYCRPGKTHVARWILKNGEGPFYENS